MRYYPLAAVAAAALILIPLVAVGATSKLLPLVNCVTGEKFSSIDVSPRTNSAPFRLVSTPSGPKKISMADGYRVILGVSGTTAFVNLRIEQSRVDEFEADRLVILEQMQALVASAPASPAQQLIHLPDAEIETIGIDNPSIEGKPVISMYTLLSRKSSRVVTMYFLNQSPSRRAFATYSEYLVLRDKALAEVSTCLIKSGV